MGARVALVLVVAFLAAGLLFGMVFVSYVDALLRAAGI